MQTHFARRGNRFYPALLAAGIIDRPVDAADGMTDADRDYFRSRGIGITNVVRRATARADELHATTSCGRAAGILVETVERTRPRSSPSSASRPTARRSRVRKAPPAGSPEPLAGAELWVVPNPSGLNAHDTVDSLAAAYAEAARAAGVLQV